MNLSKVSASIYSSHVFNDLGIKVSDPESALHDSWQGISAETVGLRSWPDSLDENSWQGLFGQPPTGIFVLVDESVGARWGQLRCVPLLRSLGVVRFTFAHAWRGLDLVPYEWVRVAEDTDEAALQLSSP